MENQAVFHKDCGAENNKSKLVRKGKLFEKESETEQGRTETIENLETQSRAVSVSKILHQLASFVIKMIVI